MKVSALRGVWLAAGALLVLLSVAVAGLASALHRRYADGLQTLEPRLQRWAGLVQAAPEIEARLRQVEDWIAPLPHAGGAAAVTDITQRVRQSLETAGLTTVALQAAEPQEWVPGLLRVRLAVTVTGPWPAAVQWLHGLQQQRPVLWVQSAQLMREGRDAPAEPQQVRLAVQIEAPLRREEAAR